MYTTQWLSHKTRRFAIVNSHKQPADLRQLDHGITEPVNVFMYVHIMSHVVGQPLEFSWW